MLCELLGLGLDLAGSVTSESESVLHSMSLSVTDIFLSLLYDHEVKAFCDWIKMSLYITPTTLLRYCLTAKAVLSKINSPTLVSGSLKYIIHRLSRASGSKD